MPRVFRGARTDEQQRRALQAMGPALRTTATKTGAYSALYGELVVGNPTAGGFTVTLPRATDHRDELVAVKNNAASGNAVTVAGLGGELIDGAGTAACADRECKWFQSTGDGGWIIV